MQVLIAAEGAIPVLVELLESGSEECKEQAAGALAGLAVNFSNKASNFIHHLGIPLFGETGCLYF